MKKKTGSILACCITMAIVMTCSSPLYAEETHLAVIEGEESNLTSEEDFHLVATEQEDFHLAFTEGEHLLENEQITGWETPVIQNSGDAAVIVRNCEILGETTEETVPLAGAPGSLLIAGNMRTTLVMTSGQGYYINSSITSRNWAVLSTDAAVPALEEGAQEAGVYAYGSEAIALEGGYGAYSDIFCRVSLFGSHLQSPEIGIISGSYGSVVMGNIADGESDPQLQAVLSEADIENQPDKERGTVVEAGRNALMIHSINLPAYWHYEGYSKEEVPLLSAEISAHDSILKTDLSLEKEISYDDQQQSYINYTKGSVILIKSTNADLQLEGCELIPDESGTGYLLQTVISNDTLYMIPVPNGETYPGIHVSMKDMTVRGDISHEDYQRDLYLTLDQVDFTGAMNQYDFDHWQEVSLTEGFPDYCTDESYETSHGLHVSLSGESVWNVTDVSHLSDLEIESGCNINGQIYLDGVLQTGEELSYHGDVVVIPA